MNPHIQALSNVLASLDAQLSRAGISMEMANEDFRAHHAALTAAIALMRGQSEDVSAARRERDEAIEAKEYAELELAYLANEMVYDGNSIGWIASKAKNYGAAILRAWDALTEVGGKCDGQTTLADAIRQHFAATKPKDTSDEQ